MPISFKKFRFFYRFFTALVSRYYPQILIGIAVGAASFLILPKLPRIVIFRPTSTFAVIGRYTTSNLPIFIQRLASLGLTTIDESGLPSTGLAQSWEATDSGKTYIFTLQPNIYWQDGKPLKSEDIKYNFKDASVSYPDPAHLKIILPDPYSPLPAVISTPVFKPNFIGTGSYKIVSIKKNGPYIDSLVLNPVDPRSRSPKLKYYFFPTESLVRLSYKLGLTGTILDISEPQELAKWANTDVIRVTHKDRYVAVFFNTQSPDFSSTAGKNLRLALAYAIDKSRWPNDDRAYGPISPLSWAYNSDTKKYEFDLDRARSLFSKLDEKPDSLTITTVPAYLEAAENIKSDWESLGIEVNISVSPDIPQDFSALLVAQAIPSDPDQYYFWHSTQPGNLTSLKNPRIDKLLEDGRKTQDLSARAGIYKDFQRYLAEEIPAIFLFHPHSYTITRH
ncbi:hypothetical protein A2899_00955 [Candidatus Amesbacteria bacterium RIFCSPLOWO2_01_FULL_49_25]|uniref:Solute-binding protein family 5 domain-containing protein n=1 Tax=Candidatus Amesbacteria bacterium RIFCSPHIGHO2_01_FULL_48_32b TaxID=1797253 RepID=A0A1F4YFH5_9BACT|nr:MAG: hypothetical protein A2876_00105 [Candidatus Amesbacteria bacterium RIFCSPHIGHO2_01_FULL_48_32b]OGD07135.1 MAG: hypothetical protein A2899_00955 [Candidatus Amesbacteria bacterium RIFCSPLOWO2_01_FULL_49_25]